MEINANDIYEKIIQAAEASFKEGWLAVKSYAPAEFKKMSVQLADVAQNVALYQIDKNQGYSPKTGKILVKMQRTSCESVLVAITQLTLITVQKALNAIMKVLKDAFGGVLAAVV
ncbi:hypothetical protein O5O45_09655 [Hahella aquimaris]|uniref:hypothetical protein n=1 Tax=Hahella sp. HNIBRBA332 TaxID=3015983 RepID=UPI00273B5C9E|nr:hypothetical protein [Hahella sp. HNIBRBA332]WLQ16179.1 hypothetical protein O5O45_09655 [Hahella sp. HNIBRBA332]